MKKRLNMSAKEYYIDKFDIDISKLPLGIRNMVASLFLEYNYFTKEELEKLIEKHCKEKNKG